MHWIPTVFKACRKLVELSVSIIYTPIGRMIFYLNGAKVGKNLLVRGILKVYVTRRGRLTIGDNCSINSGNRYNIIGRQQKNIMWVEGALTIGSNVGMSCCAIICNSSITIGDYATLGGNTVIYDTDFHSLDPKLRMNKQEDKLNAKVAPVVLERNVFIGAHTTILKGVVIGENSVIGACSVVTKSIPPNQIWAGNPATYIKSL